MNKDHLKAIAVGLSFFGFIILYVFEFQHFHNMFQVRSLLLTSAIVGLLVGVGISWYLTQGVKDAYDRMRISVGTTLLTIVFMPLLLSWINRLLVFRAPSEEKVEFLRQEGFSASRFGNYQGKNPQADGVYTFVIREGELKRLKSKDPIFPFALEGDEVTIKVLKGALGWEVVVDGKRRTADD
jgi:hypothetical protein